MLNIFAAKCKNFKNKLNFEFLRTNARDSKVQRSLTKPYLARGSQGSQNS